MDPLSGPPERPGRDRPGLSAEGPSPQLRAERAYRAGLWAMRGGVLTALFAVLVLPPGEGSILLFLAACLAVAWGAWRRRRFCPVRRRPDPG